MELWDGNVLVVSVCLSVCRKSLSLSNASFPMMHWTWIWGHWDPLVPLLVASGGHDQGPLQTCSLEDHLPPPASDIWWSRPETSSNLFTWKPPPGLTSSGPNYVVMPPPKHFATPQETCHPTPISPSTTPTCAPPNTTVCPWFSFNIYA